MTPAARVFVLAAGTGSRLMPITADRPKCMVKLGGRTLLERQLAVMQSFGLTDITIVTGYRSAQLALTGVRKVVNPDFAATNMVASLFCAEQVMHEDRDMVVSYGDIVYQRDVLGAVLEAKDAIAVCVDREWRRYWTARMDDPLADAETLKVGNDGRIVELGRKASRYEDIEGQYIGLFKIRADQVKAVKRFYHSLDRGALYDGKSFLAMFMTSFLQALIDAGFDVRPVFIRNGWLEVDTVGDVDLYSRLEAEGRLSAFYDERC